jgi:hypothetical protein
MILYAEDNPVVEVTTSPVPPVIKNVWTLSLIVDYPYPDDVSIIEPEFPFFLDRIVKYSRTLDTKNKTVFEYSFIPSESGSFIIGAFTVILPDGITRTVPVNLDIRPENEKRTLPVIRLFWEINPEKTSVLSHEDLFQMTLGERALLVLRSNGRNFSLPFEYPPQEYFMPDAPEGAILALSPLSEGERNAGIMLKLALIPLKGDFRLNARTLQYENYIFEIPPLFIRVNASAEKAGETAQTGIIKTGGLQDIVKENTQYSELPANVNTQKVTDYNTSRKFYIVSFYFVIILVIFIPFVCFILFKNEKK